MIRPPESLEVLHGTFALDGGSTTVSATGSDGKSYHLAIDWSIRARQTGRTMFTVNGHEILPGSREENEWLEKLREAVPDPVLVERPPVIKKNPTIYLLPPDEIELLRQIDIGNANRALTLRLISLVTSDKHQLRQGSVEPNPPGDVRKLWEEGRKLEAILAYRQSHPTVTVAEAKLAIEAMMAPNA